MTATPSAATVTNEAAWIPAVRAALQLEPRDRVDVVAFLMARDPGQISNCLKTTVRYLRLEADALATSRGESAPRPAACT